jgi:CubicO group peptidase (beta-lactamase class C family)
MLAGTSQRAALGRSVRTFLALWLASCLATAQAEPLSADAPENHGFSPERLARIDTHMQAAVASGEMVGALGLIARDGKVIYRSRWGKANRETGQPVTDETIFRWYSMSKPITSVALMMLYEEGRFALNDPIAKYLPDLANLEVARSTADSALAIYSDGTQTRTVGTGDDSLVGQRRAPSTRQPTIHDLLRHTAGFGYGPFGRTEVDALYREAGFPAFPGNLEAFVKTLGTLPLQYDPGTKWHYSVAAAVQGRLIEVLTGQRFGAFLKDRIFEPLAMGDAGFVVPPEDHGRFAELYAPADGRAQNRVEAPGEHGLVVANPRLSRGYLDGTPLESGGIGMVGTADDYLRFAQMLLNGGVLEEARLLSPKTLKMMTQNHLEDIALGGGAQGRGFGLGFAVVLDTASTATLSSLGEYGWGGAAGTTFWVDPAENLVGVFMIQSLPHLTRLKDEFKVLTYQAMMESRAP